MKIKWTKEDVNRLQEEALSANPVFQQMALREQEAENAAIGKVVIPVDGEVPEGYHRMPETGEIMRDSEMEGENAGSNVESV